MKPTDMNTIKNTLASAVEELCDVAGLKQGDVLVVGCSTSEVCGSKIGTDSVPEVAVALVDAVLSVLKPRGIFLAAQCCEHLNRAIVVERTCRPYDEEVNVVPMPKAGGSFATAAYAAFNQPIVLEEIRADAGLDIGGTLIGMHLKKVAVPVRLSVNSIGSALLLAARTRPKFIGGARASYDEKKL